MAKIEWSMLKEKKTKQRKIEDLFLDVTFHAMENEQSRSVFFVSDFYISNDYWIASRVLHPVLNVSQPMQDRYKTICKLLQT